MRLATVREPFDSPDWLFELKLDGFRAIADVRDRACRLISRNRHVYSSFAPLAGEIARRVTGDCVLDGEIVCLDDEGRPRFYDLLRRRGEPCFVAFDIVSLADQDLRQTPLMERKSILRRVVRERGRVLVAKYVEGSGVDLYRLVCAEDLEGIVAKWKHGRYLTGEEQPQDRSLARHARNPHAAAKLTWLKVKNSAYSQMEGRAELFEARAAGA